MKKIGICLLAYGEEHIKECIFLINNMKFYKKDIKFFVGTDSVDEFNNMDNVEVIKIDEPFNYNLKRKSVEVAFKECDVIVIMDTDIIEHVLYHGDTSINSVDFTRLNDIEDGMYCDIIQGFDLNLFHTYQKRIYDLTGGYDGLLHLFEHIIIFKITDEKVKNELMENWETFYKETLDTPQPDSLTGKKGSMEGLLIHGSAYKAGIKFTRIFNNPITDHFFGRFYHYNADNKKSDIVKLKGRSII
jgi:hypothetical protein